MRDAWSFGASALPLVTTAIHAGHDLRPEVATRMLLDDRTRRREEDPFTDRITSAGGLPIVVHRSRFEVDLNRARHACVYTSPEDSWGLEVWREPLTEEQVERSRRLHDAFYAMLTSHLDELARQGPFVVLDVHSYNHRRAGADQPAAPIGRQPGGQRRHRVARSRALGPHRGQVHGRPRHPGGGRAPPRRARERPVRGRPPGPMGARALRRARLRAGRRAARRCSWTSGPASRTTSTSMSSPTAFAASVPLLLGELACGAP